MNSGAIVGTVALLSANVEDMLIEAATSSSAEQRREDDLTNPLDAFNPTLTLGMNCGLVLPLLRQSISCPFASRNLRRGDGNVSVLHQKSVSCC